MNDFKTRISAFAFVLFLAAFCMTNFVFLSNVYATNNGDGTVVVKEDKPDSDPLLTPICRAYSLLQSFATPIIIVVFFSTGMGMFFGKINWQVAIVIMVGISLVVSADKIVETISGKKFICPKGA